MERADIYQQQIIQAMAQLMCALNALCLHIYNKLPPEQILALRSEQFVADRGRAIYAIKNLVTLPR